jgi:hypothetical protein
MSDEVTVVFTAKSVERILREGGTSAWRIDRNHARKCSYAVCTRNANADWVEGPEPHHSAFLIGKIRDVVLCEPTPENEDGEQDRYLIQFSEFARVNIPDVWKGDRNPVKYATIESLRIDLSKLRWEEMPDSTAAPLGESSRGYAANAYTNQPLTLTEAKNWLAKSLGVKPDAIEIIVRA